MTSDLVTFDYTLSSFGLKLVYSLFFCSEMVKGWGGGSKKCRL
jgi:hypothetical protein